MTTIMLFLAVLAIVGWTISHHSRTIIASNAAGVHQGGRVTRLSVGAIASRYLIVKQSSTGRGIAACGATDNPLGIVTDEAEGAGEPIMVIMPGGHDCTAKVVPSVSVAAGDFLYTGANGLVTNVPVAGCYRIGTALEAGSANIEMEADLVGFGTPWQAKAIAFAGIATMAGGAVSEAVTITGLLATDTVITTITDNAANDNASLLEAKPTADTLTLLFNEDPTAGVKVSYIVLR